MQAGMELWVRGVRAVLGPSLTRVPRPPRVLLLASNVSLASPQIYPDESHYFHSASLHQHLYRSIISFFVECFRVRDRLP